MNIKINMESTSTPKFKIRFLDPSFPLCAISSLSIYVQSYQFNQSNYKSCQAKSSVFPKRLQNRQCTKLFLQIELFVLVFPFPIYTVYIMYIPTYK